MLEQPVPSAAHRNHWYVKAADVFQVPAVTESVLPTAATPESAGRPVGVGNGITNRPADAAYLEGPLTFHALTVERTYLPLSELVSVYVEPVAPGMVLQPAAGDEQRCH
jgi:hypothetical protein